MSLFSGHASRHIFSKIAKQHNLVYFGHVDPRIDADYEMVRGLATSPHMRDENVTIGNVDDHEVIFLQRHLKIHPRPDEVVKRKWTLLQVQFNKADLPHILIDNRANGSMYGAMLMSALRSPEIGWQNFTTDEKFAKAFSVHAKPQSVQEIRKILTPEIQKVLMTHFSTFDYELQSDKLIIYAGGNETDPQTLDHMLRIGLILAKHVDQFAAE